MKDKIAPFIKYLGIIDNIDYETEIEDTGLNKIETLTLSNGQDFIKYKTKKSYKNYQGDLGETESSLEFIIPKEKFKDDQYYILSATIRIRRVYFLKLKAYTVDFKKWYTNCGLIEV